MKLNKVLLAGALAALASASPLLAQENPENPRPRPGRPDGGMRPPMPLVAALDANRDGVIDATEINNAANALRALDKNGDGQLTPDEFRPARPAGVGPQNGQGPRGEGRRQRMGPGPRRD